MKKILLGLTLLASISSFGTETDGLSKACLNSINENSIGAQALYDRCVDSKKAPAFVESCRDVALMMNGLDQTPTFVHCLELKVDISVVRSCTEGLSDYSLMARPIKFFPCTRQ